MWNSVWSSFWRRRGWMEEDLHSAWQGECLMCGKTIIKPPIWEWFIPPIYGDLGDGLLLFYPHDLNFFGGALFESPFHDLPFISLHFPSFPFISLHFPSFPFISLHFPSFPRGSSPSSPFHSSPVQFPSIPFVCNYMSIYQRKNRKTSLLIFFS